MGNGQAVGSIPGGLGGRRESHLDGPGVIVFTAAAGVEAIYGG